MHISVLDLGSTTFHLQTFEVDGSGRFATRHAQRRVLNLGHDVYSTGRIGDDKWDEAVAAVGELLEANRAFPADVTLAVATSALRDASNGLAFRVELWNRYRLGVQLLTPEQEARFTYLGASTTPQVGGRRVAVFDLGGGSLEIAVGEGTRCLFAKSLPLGALNVHATLFSSGSHQPRDLGTVHQRVREVGRDVFAEVRALAPELLVFASGTARSVRQQVMQGTTEPGKLGPLTALSLRQAIHHGWRSPVADPRHVAAEPAVQAAGAIILSALDVLETEHAIVSDKGLRDGVALDVLRRTPKPAADLPLRVWNRRMASLASVPANLARRD